MGYRLLGIGVLALLAIALGPECRAQTRSKDPFADLPALPDALRRQMARRLTFRLVAEIPLPGPLPGRGPRWVEDRIEIPVAGGTARTSLEADAPLELRPESDALSPEQDEPWALDAEGKFRCRSLPDGWILAQRRCGRCAEGWKKKWKLRVPGHAPAPPLVRDRRVYFGARDNQIYCVKRKNGHRIWTYQVNGRISGRLVPWSGEIVDADREQDEPEIIELALILAVPDGGAQLIALSEELGQPVASVSVPAGEGYLLGPPLTAPDGQVVVAWQKYSQSDASLMVYRLEAAAPLAPDGAEEQAPTILSSPIFLR